MSTTTTTVMYMPSVDVNAPGSEIGSPYGRTIAVDTTYNVWVCEGSMRSDAAMSPDSAKLESFGSVFVSDD